MDERYLFATTPGGVHIYPLGDLVGGELHDAVVRVREKHGFPGEHGTVPDEEDWDLTMRTYIPTVMLKVTEDEPGKFRQGPADHVTMHDRLP